MRRVVYLSGRIDNLTYEEAVRDRNRATELLLEAGWDVLDPMRGKEHLRGTVIRGGENFADAAIIFRDLDDIHRADVILVLTASEPSWGTAMEWSHAAIACRKPVVAVDPKHIGRKSPWCRNHCLYFADSVDGGVAWLTAYLDRGYKLGNHRAAELAAQGRAVRGEELVPPAPSPETGPSVGLKEGGI